MKKTILLSLILACGTLTTQSQGLTNATLWKITTKGNENPSFIMLAGPVCSSSMALTTHMKRALTQVRTIAMDYNLYDSKDAAKFQAYTLASADSQRIRNNLSTGEFQTFNDIIKNNGIPDNLAQQFYTYKIGMLYYLLLMLNSPCGILTGQSSYETILKPYAKKNNLEYLVFQSIDDYLAEDSRHSNEYWRRNIRYLLNNEDEIKNKLQTEINLYDQSNLSALRDLYSKDRFYQLRFSDAIGKQHVQYLAGKIDAQVKQTPTFIAIQSSNVLNSTPTLFDLLKAKGYELNPVTD